MKRIASLVLVVTLFFSCAKTPEPVESKVSEVNIETEKPQIVAIPKEKKQKIEKKIEIKTSMPLDSMSAFVKMMADMKEDVLVKEVLTASIDTEAVKIEEVTARLKDVHITKMDPVERKLDSMIAKEEVIQIKIASTKMVEKIDVTEKQHLSVYDNLLMKYVSASGEVDYKGLKGEVSKLKYFTKDCEAFLPLPSASEAKKMAFWINMYNAHMLLAIVENYPVMSPMDLANGKIWDEPLVNMGGKLFSLNQVEHGILRKTFKDPRIHFAVNCAAKSCPPLYNKAWNEDNLVFLLEKSTKAFINNPSYNDISKKSLKVSKIFEWYKEDFGDIVSFVKRYSDLELAKAPNVSYSEYNWDLNEK